MKYFRLEEFQCKCGCGSMLMSPDFLAKLDAARDIAGVPFVINSGMRCQEHNRNVGSKPTSAHTKGMAADIAAIDSRSRFHIMRGSIGAQFNRIGLAKDFIHVDIDPDKDEDVIWVYS